MTTYKQLRNNGMKAIEAFNRAKAGGTWADIKPRYIYPSYNGSGWIENVSAALRFVKFADEITSFIKHQGWFTSEHEDEVLRGAVYRLTHNRFLAGYADPYNPDCARIDFSSVYDCENEAARAADRFAESEAEKTREYNAAWQAGSDYTAAGESMAECREVARDYIGALREAIPQADVVTDKAKETICSALRGNIKNILRDMEKLRSERAELLNGYWIKEAFNDGAGIC